MIRGTHFGGAALNRFRAEADKFGLKGKKGGQEMPNVSARKAPQPQPNLTEGDLIWKDMLVDTTFTIRGLLSNRELFVVLAGAVFALHQDMLRATGIDMRIIDDGGERALLDINQPHRIGDFAERIGQTMKALGAIDEASLDFLRTKRSSRVSEDNFQTHALMEKMRSTAARVWLLTVYSKIGNVPMMGVGATAIWLMLQQVAAEDILEIAMKFSGTYFEDTRSDEMNLSQWGSGWA